MPKILRNICLGAMLLVALGCRGKETYPVSGKVSFNGEAVTNGQIIFAPADKKTAPSAGRIENGEYQLQATSGAMRVEIRAARVVRNVPGALGPEYQDYIPPAFNSDSKLTANVEPTENNRFDFNLTF